MELGNDAPKKSDTRVSREQRGKSVTDELKRAGEAEATENHNAQREEGDFSRKWQWW